MTRNIVTTEPPRGFEHTRSVRPRSRSYRVLPIIAICGEATLNEDGEFGTVTDLIATLPTRPPTLFARQSAADFVAYLNGIYLLRYPETWQWRAMTDERSVVRGDGNRVATRVTTIVHWFGWKNKNFHRIIDPISMYGHKLDKIWPGDDGTIIRLLKWAVAIRDFCADSDMEVRPTIGSISAQFLKDRRFYPRPRRKVPARTNERGRERLPGNYYRLNVYPTPGREFHAHYLDQSRAHHYHARTLALPDSNHLYAYGRFTDLDGIALPRPVPHFYGLYCLDLDTPKHRGYFQWLRHDPGERHLTKQFVFSNELPHLIDAGYMVTGVRAAWGSRTKDTGLARYAEFAEQQLDLYSDARWLKPLLLATYGTLATRAKYAEAIFRLASRGEPVTIFTGHRQLNGLYTQGKVKLEPETTNLLHRGMIESATRSESIGLAQWLESQNHRVLSIYADAVIVEADDDRKLPTLPEPWRLKQDLTHLRYINQQAFVSGEMTKLPGVGRELMAYRQQRTGPAPRSILKHQAVTGNKIYERIGTRNGRPSRNPQRTP